MRTSAVTFDFVREHYEQLVGDSPDARLPKEGGPRVLAQVLEQVDPCIALKAAQGGGIQSFLRQRATPPRR